MHWVKWDVVSKPKALGGLGLQSASGRNTTLLAKLNWRFTLRMMLLGPRFLNINIVLCKESIRGMKLNS